MHETAVASQLVDLVLQQIAGRIGRVSEVKIRVGVWSGIAAEALASAYPAAAQGLLDGSKLSIEPSELSVWCETCQTQRELGRGKRLVCPVCGGRTPRILSGKELELVSIEMNHDSPNS